jgi:hypothetical protein
MFLAMVLTNAKRAEASEVVLTVEADKSRIDMLLLDGSSQPLTAPPPEVLLRIIAVLEGGQNEFCSNVFTVTVEKVEVERGSGTATARIRNWSIGHS